MSLKKFKKFLASALIAGLIHSSNAEELDIYNGAINSSIGSSHMFNNHAPNSLENIDSNDDTRNTSTSTNLQWLSIYSIQNETELRRDSRPIESETIFTNYLKAIDSLGSGINSSNRLKFSINSNNNNRIWIGKLSYVGEINQNQVIDIRKIIEESGGYFGIRNLTNQQEGIYAILEISCRQKTKPSISKLEKINSYLNLEAKTQPGTTLEVKSSTDLNSWQGLTNRSYYLIPTTNNFNKTLEHIDFNEKIIITNLPINQKGYFRLGLN